MSLTWPFSKTQNIFPLIIIFQMTPYYANKPMSGKPRSRARAIKINYSWAGLGNSPIPRATTVERVVANSLPSRLLAFFFIAEQNGTEWQFYESCWTNSSLLRTGTEKNSKNKHQGLMIGKSGARQGQGFCVDTFLRFTDIFQSVIMWNCFTTTYYYQLSRKFVALMSNCRLSEYWSIVICLKKWKYQWG